MPAGRHKHYAAKAMLDNMISSIKSGPDTIVMGIPQYVAYRLCCLRSKPPVHTLHKAAWDAGYKVNGFHPDKMGSLTNRLPFINMTPII